MLKFFFFFCIFSTFIYTAQAQRKNKKSGKTENAESRDNIIENIIPNLQKHIKVLASDSFEGRRTGTPGEQMAINYIKNVWEKYGITPKGNGGSYLQNFEVKEGLQYETFSLVSINDKILVPIKEYFPLNAGSNGEVSQIISPNMKEQNSPWILDLKDEFKKNEKNPHFDIAPFVDAKILDFVSKGATAVVIINTSNQQDNLFFDAKAKTGSVKVPVIYITKDGVKKHLPNITNPIELKLKIEFIEKQRNGTNVIAQINNNADNTIILGAHFDHLGHGEDHNSLFAGKDKMVHNGADDNASGVAALLEVSKLLKQKKYNKSNYIFIAFSGEELGLYGSKYFTENPTLDLSKVNYMINMDMIGRLNDSTKAFTIGGYGTSPTWGTVINEGSFENGIVIKIDSSGTGPSDHSSFYRKDIPVLFFFTGTHSDYHKPSDDFEKINFGGEEKIVAYILYVINKTISQPKLTFTKTRENSNISSRRFTVSLGIMPDYTFSGSGVRADGVSEGKLAQKIGIKAGDVITKLGDYEINSVESYMKVLGKFQKGDNVKLITTRSGKEIKYDITF